jgi:hypothetical protein
MSGSRKRWRLDVTHSDQLLRQDDRYREAHRLGDGRGDPHEPGFRRRLTVEPERADSIMVIIAILCAAAMVVWVIAGRPM